MAALRVLDDAAVVRGVHAPPHFMFTASAFDFTLARRFCGRRDARTPSASRRTTEASSD